MKKIILTIILLQVFLFASHEIVSAKYKVSYGAFLSLGEAKAIMKIDGDNYEISIVAKATGLARLLSNNRVETYKSFGKIVNDEFIPNKFIKIKKTNFKYRKRTFTFDNENKKVHVKYYKKEQIRKLDEQFEQYLEEFEESSEKNLDYYASQDILSLFFNLKNRIPKYENGKDYELKAVGANKTKGKINVLLPNKKIKELNKKDSTQLIAYINQKIFGSKRGELFISLNSDGFCNQAILKDVLLFGDIVGEMVEFKTKG